MQDNSSAHYITRIHAAEGVYNTYQGQTILFTPYELHKLLRPGLFHELRLHGKYRSMYGTLVTDPTDYKLDDPSQATALTEKLRDTLASALLFIHSHTRMIQFDGLTYSDYFERMFAHIIETTQDEAVIELAQQLDRDVKEISQYLGEYKGDMREVIMWTRDLLLIITTGVTACAL